MFPRGKGWYNCCWNKNGKFIRLILGGKESTEGINMFNTRWCHVLDTPVTYNRQSQIFGRIARQCGLSSHKWEQWTSTIMLYSSYLMDSVDSASLKIRRQIDFMRSCLELFRLWSDSDGFCREVTKRPKRCEGPPRLLEGHTGEVESVGEG